MPTTIDVALPRPLAPARAGSQGVWSRVRAVTANADFICIVSLIAIAFAVSIALTVFVPLPADTAAQLIQSP